ncbi:TLR4 interactor with leucine rich repeats [Chelonia mydas]|uniref:TLR4 interactor with leucine rich repeats n=1 Tax=Chelonia mydas TaxID=8469 RepID=M7C088_CHEMY|nr:TLR4 interactor with leucine rich repeats [Chelonia mydas]
MCPEPCDCQLQQHLLCTNRGLRVVPKTADPQGILTYSLGGNFIANISAFDFHHLAGLQRLDLQYNRIRWLHPKAFERLTLLEELYLGNNRLVALAPGTLRLLAKLRILYMNANEIGRLSTASFAGLGSLVKLRLDGNALASLGEATFSGLPNLLYLHLESNHIRWLSRGAFTGLSKLRFLDLSGNQQSSLRHPETFGPLGSLSTLLLSGNSLQQLGGGLFQHLPSLAKLSLSGNRLDLAPDAFAGLGALKELRLDGNLLSHLPATLPLRSLEALDLSRNVLAALHPAAFGPLPKLRELSLRDNALAVLPGELFASSLALQHLELDGNAWSCDCRLRGLKRWLGTRHSQGRLLTVFVQCRLPPALAGKYLDYLQDAQLLPPDGPDCHSGASPSPSPPPATGQWPREPPGWAHGTHRAGCSLSLCSAACHLPWLASTSTTFRTHSCCRPMGPTATAGPPHLPPRHLQQGNGPGSHSGRVILAPEGLGGNTSHSPAQGGPRSLPSASTMRLLGVQEGPAPGRGSGRAEPTPTTSLPDLLGSSRPSLPLAGPAWPRRARKHHLAPSVAGAPLVSDPCDFNKLFLCNLSVEAVSTSSVTVRWWVRPHRSPRLLGPVRFRLLFDRFGAAIKFQRFVYLAEWSEPAATLRELRPDTPYLVCVEGVLGGRVCPVAPRDHCVGLVTLPNGGTAGGPDQQLLTLVLLAVNALLLFVALAAWVSRLSHRPPRGAVACALSETDLIEFPCERFADSSSARRGDDHLLQQRFAD